MKLSRKEKSAYWMPYTDNRWFKSNPKLLESAKGMYYKTSDGKKILDGVAGLWCVNAGHCRTKMTTLRGSARQVTFLKHFENRVTLVQDPRYTIVSCFGFTI